ncbi:MAG: ATP-binding domain-containing protein, partial [Muribaculaceae bacterium]|nr:ATP-binding domain-containing protein [Muribaculaceae bacterium]
ATLHRFAAAQARLWLAENPEESVAILTRTNAEAVQISDVLESRTLEHFLVAQNDSFHSASFKTVWAHLAVSANSADFHSWARILYQTQAVKTLKAARQYVKALSMAALTPTELFSLINDGRPTAVTEFCCAMTDPERTIVVLDTETTGLDIYNDDVVQFAAVKMRAGKILKDSGIELFIETRRRIPAILSEGTRNPLPLLYENAEKFTPEEAFRRIIAYIGSDSILAGHNIGFDLSVLRENIVRRTDLAVPAFLSDTSQPIDSLYLSRLLYPRLRSHRLGFLIEAFGLKGTNSHSAADDTNATAALLSHITEAAIHKLDLQKRFLDGKNYMSVLHKLCSTYSAMHTQARLLMTRDPHSASALPDEMERIHSSLCDMGLIRPIKRFEYIIDLTRELISTSGAKNYREQIAAHLTALRTFNESDLLTSGFVRERISVMTIHKAKGLEMDNVIIADDPCRRGSLDEQARVLYVGVSRPRRRLAIGYISPPSCILAS